MKLRNARPSVATGFTLVELLVVISIIALLLSILMPALSKARQAGYRAVCGSKLKQLGIAAHTYAASDNGDLPEAYYIGYFVLNGKNGGGHRLAFHRLIDGKYIDKKSKIWLCPGDRKPVTVTIKTANYPWWTMPEGQFSYGWNVFLGFRSDVSTNGWAVFSGPGNYNVGRSRNPSRVLVARDAALIERNPSHMQARGAWASDLGINHNKSGYNAVCADGHVDWVNSVVKAQSYIYQLGPEQTSSREWTWHW